MPVEGGKEYVHLPVPPFEPMLSRSLSRQGKVFLWLYTFLNVFFGILAIRAVLELHRAGRPVAWLIGWAAYISGGIIWALWLQSKRRAPPSDSKDSTAD